MEALEQKVLALMGEKDKAKTIEGLRCAAHDQFRSDLEALPGYKELFEEHREVDEESAGLLLGFSKTVDNLKQEILAAMTEKTHKFKCATVSKRINRGLKVHSPLRLFEELRKINLSDLAGVTFKKPKVIQAIELGALVMPAKGEAQFAEITETETLVIK